MLAAFLTPRSLLAVIIVCFFGSLAEVEAQASKPEKTIVNKNLVIISPHRKSIQQEFIPRFERHILNTQGVKVEVQWLDQGGASDVLRFLLGRYESSPAGVGVDISWGGGEPPFFELDGRRLLIAHPLKEALAKEVPATLGSLPLRNATQTWHATALSSFGIFYNKAMAKILKVPEPTTWEDLAKPNYFNQLSNADPRRSSSSVTMTFMILESLGWEEGWKVLSGIAGNTRTFTHSSSDPIKAVVSGNAVAGLTITYYAQAKIGDIGSNKLGFVMPLNKSIMNADPIAILKGAPNVEMAKAFVDFVLSAPAQKLFLLSKKEKDGPTYSTLARTAVNIKAYKETQGRAIDPFNPFAGSFAQMTRDTAKATQIQFVFADLLGAIHIDVHKDLKSAWQKIIKRGLIPSEVAEFSRPPLTEKELLSLEPIWSDNIKRNRLINDWVAAARAKYARLANLPDK